MNELKLMILDPGHFHAALLQKEMYPDVSRLVSVYSPLGPELIDYLNRVAQFNNRAASPTSWELAVHTSDHSLEHMLHARPGNCVVLSGRNRSKIHQILQSVEAGLNVLADKPWVIRLEDLPLVDKALEIAEKKGLVAFDIMTERFEITSILQRLLVNGKAVFGEMQPGTAEQPAIYAKSVHHLMKMVAGTPLRRPVWFFDTDEYGEALSDVGTHVVDLVQWTAFPDKILDYQRDIEMISAKHWPTEISATGFLKVTGSESKDKANPLLYNCNNAVHYKLRGVHVKLDILWNWEAPEGTGDVYVASFQGTKARIEIRQGKPENYRPEVYVVPNSSDASAALKQTVTGWQQAWPDIAIAEENGEFRIQIPPQYRVSHEAHFAQVANQFFKYLQSPISVPEWERAGMMAKYYVSTKAIEMSC